MLLAATVLLRRRYPVAAFAAAMMIGAAQVIFGMQPGGGGPPVRALEPTATDLAIPVLLYTLAAYRPRRVSLTGLAVCLLGAAVAIARWAPAQPPASANLVFVAAAGLGGTTLTAWVLGDSVAYRYRRAYYASLEERPPGWKPNVTRRPGSPPRRSGPANCRTGGPGRSTSRPPGCAGSSATCTTGPRCGWPRWP